MNVALTKKNIPDGWSAVLVGDVFTFAKSYAFSRDNLVDDTSNNKGVGNIHYGDIHSTFSSPSINLQTVSVPMVKDSSFAPRAEDFLQDGDLIMADASEDYEGVGVTVSLHGLKGKKIVGGLHTFVLRDEKGKTSEYYRQYIFRNPKIRNTLQKVANGVSVYGISKTAVSKVILPLPPLPEQNRIVAVLETWDKAIEKLKKKIELKKQIKKGLMQQLLTGKKRLPGFKGEWDSFKLGELVDGVSERNRKLKVSRVLSVTNKEGFVLPESQFSRVVASEDLSNYKVISKGDFAYNPSRINVGSIARLDSFDTGILSPMYVAFRPNQKINSDYLHQWLFTKEANSKIRSYASGSVRESVDFRGFCSIKLSIPQVPEQAAISGILAMADKEIDQLEQKLSLLQGQKKYLLNNLITGAIRTPEKMKIKSLK